ncbi:MAG: glucose 1-dehydrogenase [Gammaproteobacteria bacterium]
MTRQSNSPEFAGKVALVTGAASGIGQASARAFAAAGAAVVVCDIDEAGGSALAQELERGGTQAMFLRTDATLARDNEAMVHAAVERFGRLDFAHNNAGHGLPHTTVVTTTEEEWDYTLNLTLKSAWLGMKYEIPQMIAQGGGAIVNTASMAGVLVSLTASPSYSAAKAAVIHMTKHAAVTYATQGVRINAVAPGLTATRAVTSIMTTAQQNELAARSHAIPRIVQPEEIADAVIWLCSSRAAMVTGLTVPVDGGHHANSK